MGSTSDRDVEMAPPKSGGKRGTVDGASVQNLVKFSIRATPLPKEIWDFLQDNLAIIRKLQQGRTSQDVTNGSPDLGADDEFEEVDFQGELIKRPTVKPTEFWTKLTECCDKAGGEWVGILDSIWAFGPQRKGTCLLIDARNQENKRS